MGNEQLSLNQVFCTLEAVGRVGAGQKGVEPERGVLPDKLMRTMAPVVLDAYLGFGNRMGRQGKVGSIWVEGIWSDDEKIMVGENVVISPVDVLKVLVEPMSNNMLKTQMIGMALREGNVRAAEVIALFDPDLEKAREWLRVEYSYSALERGQLADNLLKITSFLMEAEAEVLGNEEKIGFLGKVLAKLIEESKEGGFDYVYFQGDLRVLMTRGGEELQRDERYPWDSFKDLAGDNANTLRQLKKEKKKLNLE